MTHRSVGFTLVELVIVLALIGLLLTIVIPRLSSTRDKALIATMKTDLRNLVTAEELWKVDSGRYTSSFPPVVWDVSSGVTGPTITITGDGWTAAVGHESSTRTCAVFVGSTTLPPAVHEGVPACMP